MTLKGRKAGFELQLADGAGIAEICVALTTLLTKLAADTPEGNVDFMLETGDRQLNEAQQSEIQQVFAQFPRFAVRSVHANVAAIAPLKSQLLAHTIHLVGGILRSGQVIEMQGDVLFVGSLHTGATLKASGSIFVMGDVAGLLIAGSNGDQDAVITGNIKSAGQIRIADTVEIIEKNDYDVNTLSYINDLHILSHGKLADLEKLRPKLFRKLEDF
ncbi:septum site-determining protein MinC [Lacticaseibacillus yichunensis]|uniref:Septum site-determining protein MinC n=1 Tax=Lacticaseibacillus yichunensis TaxID=2486015 RepID=A0ABW4CP18_9LACO|nr:septum site-determining protein MinC [Lacticaseibacillus yichunensis]